MSSITFPVCGSYRLMDALLNWKFPSLQIKTLSAVEMLPLKVSLTGGTSFLQEQKMKISNIIRMVFFNFSIIV
jgi:hypothetical protein